MATVVYEQKPDKWGWAAGLGEGIGALGNILGQVIAQKRDQNILDQTLEEAQQKYAAGDSSGLIKVLSQVQTPEARRKIMDSISMSPQPIYTTDTETGGVKSIGSIPANAKWQAPDRSAEVSERMYELERMKGERQAKHDQAEGERKLQIEQARENRRQAIEDAKDFRQQQRLEFMDRLQTRREDHQLKLQDLKNQGAKKDDIRKEGRLLFKDYATEQSRIRRDAQAQIKTLGTPLTNPNYKEQLQGITDQVKSDLDQLNSTYAPLAEEYGYKLPKGMKGKADQSQKQEVRRGTYNGRKVIQYSDGSIDYAD